jgi:hypothetical protein
MCAACVARIPHDTFSGYTNWRCRCTSCRVAARTYHHRRKTRIELVNNYGPQWADTILTAAGR